MCQMTKLKQFNNECEVLYLRKQPMEGSAVPYKCGALFLRDCGKSEFFGGLEVGPWKHCVIGWGCILDFS